MVDVLHQRQLRLSSPRQDETRVGDDVGTTDAVHTLAFGGVVDVQDDRLQGWDTGIKCRRAHGVRCAVEWEVGGVPTISLKSELAFRRVRGRHERSRIRTNSYSGSAIWKRGCVDAVLYEPGHPAKRVFVRERLEAVGGNVTACRE